MSEGEGGAQGPEVPQGPAGEPPAEAIPAPRMNKTCPECAEEVHLTAAVCRHCGYDFRTGGRIVTARGQTTNGFAVTSMILGIVWIYGIASAIAIVFAVIAKRQIRESNGVQKGEGFATAGLVLGIVGVVATVLFIALLFAIFANYGASSNDSFSTALSCAGGYSRPTAC